MVRNEKTRKLIIEKTAAVFNKKGYAGTYLSDLTASTGLTKGSIYGNFKNKNEVAVEAFRYNLKFQTQAISARMEQLERADEKLIAFLDHLQTDYQRIFNNGGCAILNTAVDADDGNEELREEVSASIHQWIQQTKSILDRGVSRGEIETLDTLAFSHRMIALIEGSVMLSKTLNEPQILLNNFDQLRSEIRKLSLQ